MPDLDHDDDLTAEAPMESSATPTPTQTPTVPTREIRKRMRSKGPESEYRKIARVNFSDYATLLAGAAPVLRNGGYALK